MRCPKCGYISFDKVTSCSKCETDITELASSLNGTGFQPMNNFFLGTLLPDYMTMNDDASGSVQDAADDLDISMEDLDNLGDIGSIPGENDGLDLGLSDLDMENENTISLQGVVVPEVDLSDFDDSEFDNIDTMQISSEQLDEFNAQPMVDDDDDDEQIDLADIPDFSLEGVDLEEGGSDDSDISFSDEEITETVADMPSLDLHMENEAEEDATTILNVEDLDLAMAEEEPLEQENTAIDLSAIDLSLGEDELDDVSDLADLDLGDLEMETDSDAKDDNLPDLEL